ILYAVSDKGGLFHLRPIFRDGALVDLKLLRAAPLRELKTDQPLRRKRTDAEGLTIAPGSAAADTELLISFERFPRIVRYRTDGYQRDNFGGVAHLRGSGYFLVSDNNDLFVQRALLMYFELVEE